MKNTFKAGAFYFAVVFAAGFIISPLRKFFLIPEFGIKTAELIILPIMLLIIIFSAKWIMHRFNIPGKSASGIITGIIALGLMLLAEFSVVLKVQDLTIKDYLLNKDPVSGIVYYITLGAFTIAPFLLKQKQIKNREIHNKSHLPIKTD